MSNDSVSKVYRHVIDRVIEVVRPDFEDMGLGDSVLEDLQRSWETKVARSQVANFGYEYGEDGDERTGAEALSLNQHFAQGPAASLASLASSSASARHPYNLPQMTAEALANSRTHFNGQQHQSPDPGMSGTRQNIPQNDGPVDEMTTPQIDAQLAAIANDQRSGEDLDPSFSATTASGTPISLESLPESVQMLIRDARERVASPNPGKKAIAQLDGDVADEDDINSDLDDPDDADADAEGGEEIEHIILCLYDKVTRTKNKWKCVLKDGIMLVNGRDYLFHRANGDFEW